ncbi:hypothetical protein CH063_00744 [Colletotrichum higginsianum]|uniref:Uncharacterized protein n=2 Tax=Colletotrichum higginsianum TaxID=80884 RepID=H1UVN8_COLHI|nr:hypothetical protein CH63R_03616 [Colletotrichum higginsianum IMI 349063]OBR11320.1 hypothetical protein CH63R_03616 [Colletotrichum higginsianum IMI 349063]TIC99906.1 hypothetical protein CH35J_006476 [Colletotrichum higginsianum]GJC92968.1 hypothetical protein ColKHC_01794 [Colletotrichum higginsianum]CCF32039.1 hypothetical protein CH063_00744 [Colletotrichum higginsianum]
MPIDDNMENHREPVTTNKSINNTEKVTDPHATTAGGSALIPHASPVSVPILPPTIHLTYGRLGQEKVYTVLSNKYDTPCTILVDMHWYSSSFSLKVFGGDSRNSGVVATAHGKAGPFFSRSFLEVALPPLPPTQISQTKIITKWRSALCGFSMVIGGKEECFEWRRTTDAEAKQIGKGLRRKLVRVSGPNSGTGGAKALREAGFSSDGKEVVAFMADNSSWNLGHGLTIRFKGSGLGDILGEQWRISALLSALWLWWIDLERYGTTVAGAGAVTIVAGVGLGLAA